MSLRVRMDAPRQVDHARSTRVLIRGISFFFQAEDGIRDVAVTGVQTCALPIFDCPFSKAKLTRMVFYQEKRSTLSPCAYSRHSFKKDVKRSKKSSIPTCSSN